MNEWWVPTTKPVHLFTDASGGGGGHLGAVLLIDGECHWTHMEVSEQLQGMFVNRADNQIMGLELLGVSLGMSTFEKLLWGRRVIAHCDNRGAEVRCLHPHRRRSLTRVLGPLGQVAIRRGTARKYDHAQLVQAHLQRVPRASCLVLFCFAFLLLQAQWLQAARLRMQLWVRRVTSKQNIADLPSRKVSCQRVWVPVSDHRLSGLLAAP